MTLTDLLAVQPTYSRVRVRRCVWSSPTAYAVVDHLTNGQPGPWLRLFDRQTQTLIGEPTPQVVVFSTFLGDSDWVLYEGLRDPADVDPVPTTTAPERRCDRCRHGRLVSVSDAHGAWDAVLCDRHDGLQTPDWFCADFSESVR